MCHAGGIGSNIQSCGKDLCRGDRGAVQEEGGGLDFPSHFKKDIY